MNTSRNAWIPRLRAWKGRIGRHVHANPAPEHTAGLSPSPRHIDIPSPPGGEATAVASDDTPASPAQAGRPGETATAAATVGAAPRSSGLIPDAPAPTSPAPPTSQEGSPGIPAPAATPGAPTVANPRPAPPLHVDELVRRSPVDPDSPPAPAPQGMGPAEPAVSPTRPRTLDLLAEAAQANGHPSQGRPDATEGPASGREFMNTSFDPGASDLSRTNELLEQLLAETRRRAVAYLPASGPGWNR